MDHRTETGFAWQRMISCYPASLSVARQGLSAVRQRFTITITDFRGSRHLSLHQMVRLFLLGLGMLVLVTLVSGGGIIWWMGQEVAQLQERRDAVRAEHDQLMAMNLRLMRTVDEQDSELTYLTNELTEIEALMGVGQDQPASLSERLDTATHTALERMTFLQNVPSGYPLQNRGVTSDYGWRTHPVHNERRFHTGIDLRAPVGTPVLAPADGVVEHSGYHRQSGFGNLIILNHNFGFRTYFAHLDDMEVEAGEFVRKGDVIGYTGETGVTDGPHLHYEIWHIQRRLDPRPFLEWSLANYDALFAQESAVNWDGLEDAVRLRLKAPVYRLAMRDISAREAED